MNYLCVLEEPIGHAGTLPALLELGSNTGGTSWGPGSRRISQRGAGSIRALERKPSLRKRRKSSSQTQGKISINGACPPPWHNLLTTLPDPPTTQCPPHPSQSHFPAGPSQLSFSDQMAWVLCEASWPLAEHAHTYTHTQAFLLAFFQNIPPSLLCSKAVIDNSPI